MTLINHIIHILKGCHIVIIIFISLLIFMSSYVNAESNTFKLGEAAGRYIGAVQLVIELKNSTCGYVIKKEYSLEETLENIITHLNETDGLKLKKYINSNDFQSEKLKYRNMISGSLKNGKNNDLDEKTICGMTASNFAMILKYAKDKWDYAKNNYTE